MPRLPHPLAPPEFLREAEAFNRLKPELLKQYKGRVVAIYQGKVVMIGDTVADVHAAVIDKFGVVHCYVDYVQENPRIVRIPSLWRVREQPITANQRISESLQDDSLIL